MSNSKKQKPSAWRMTSVAPPEPQKPESSAGAQDEIVARHRGLWRGGETTTEALDAPRQTDTASRPSAWRGKVVSASTSDAPALTAASSLAVAPVSDTRETPSAHELTTATSLDDLFKAILGDQAGDTDDRALLLETVEAQVRGIRDELGLPEPVVEVPKPVPAPVVAQAAPVPDRTLGSFETDHSASKRSPGLFRMVAGLALGRFSHS